MAYYPATPFVPQFFNDAGVPLSGGSVTAYLAGTTTPTNMFIDDAGTSAGSVITLNARGEPAVSGNTVVIWLDDAVAYKFVLKDASSASKWAIDDISNPGGQLRVDLADNEDEDLGSALVGHYDPVAPAYLKTVSDMLNAEPVSVLRFIPQASWSAIKDYSSTTDVSSNLNEAFAAFEANGGGALDLTYGRYVIEDPLIVQANDFTIRGAGWGATHLYRAETATGDLMTVARPTPASNQLRGFTLTDVCIWAGLDVSADASLHILNATRVATDRVFIRNCHRGLHLEGIRDSRFNGLEIVSNEHYTTTRSTSCHMLFDAPANSVLESTETFFTNFNFTTATGQPDLARSLVIRGALDGIWFQNGHMFGGNTSGVLIDGNSQSTEMSGLTFNHVWFDQYTPRNMIIQGESTNFRLMTFNNCRFWGGSTNNITIDSGSNIQDVTFNSCEIGVTLGQGLQVGAGQVTANNTIFKRLNQAVSANGYAAQVVGSAAADTSLTIVGGTIDTSNLTYGVQCADTDVEYHLHNITFEGSTSELVSEIDFTGTSLVGSCGGHKLSRTAAGNYAAASSVATRNIAVDSVNLEGSTASVATITPHWHGRRITLKADSADQNMVSGGNIRNKSNAASVTIVNTDMAQYEYSADSARWHEL